jgi:hypothetical protein
VGSLGFGVFFPVAHLQQTTIKPARFGFAGQEMFYGFLENFAH